MRKSTLALSIFLATAVGCQSQQDRTVAEIEGVGGTVEINKAMPGSPLVVVDLHGAAGVDAIVRRLEIQTHLHKLDLGGTDVTDDGLAPVHSLGELETLNLTGTQIGDKGLAHIAGLTHLKELGLGATHVTDAGLAHLRGLKDLKKINLYGTKVTEEGTNELRKSLPEVDVQR